MDNSNCKNRVVKRRYQRGLHAAIRTVIRGSAQDEFNLNAQMTTLKLAYIYVQTQPRRGYTQLTLNRSQSRELYLQPWNRKRLVAHARYK